MNDSRDNTLIFEYTNILKEEFNSLLALLCFDSTFKALSSCEKIKVVTWNGVIITRFSGSLNITIQGNNAAVLQCKNCIDDNLPSFATRFGIYQYSKSNFTGSIKRDHRGFPIRKNAINDNASAIRNFKKRSIEFIKQWRHNDIPAFELLELKNDVINFIKDLEVFDFSPHRQNV